MAGTDRLSITVRSQIPMARGLGSSAALAVAAAAAAGAQDPLGVAAAWTAIPTTPPRRWSGAWWPRPGSRAGSRRSGCHLDVSLAFVVIVPDVTLSTSRARQALPNEVSRESAAFNLSRMALLIAGLADSRVLISEATEDRLHQDYRSPLFPAAPKLLAGMAAGGALAVCWSGAGPSLLGICRQTEAQYVQAAARRALAEVGIAGQVLTLHPDMHGWSSTVASRPSLFDFNAG